MARADDDGEAQVIEGGDLKAALKQLKKKSMKFAFGVKEGRQPVLLLHRTKSPQALANQLKKELGALQATHGTASSEGEALVLDVEGSNLPGMAKLVKTLLRKEKVSGFTEARVRAGGVEQADDSPAPGESGQGIRAEATLLGLKGELLSKEKTLGAILKRVQQPQEGDQALLTGFAQACLKFANLARESADPKLREYGLACVERARRMTELAKRFPASPTAAPAPGAPPPPAAPGAKQGSSPVPEGASVDVGWKERALGVKKSADGTTISIKQDKDLSLLASNFMIWVIPCYTKGGLKASFEGAATIGAKSGGSLSSTCAGTLELGIGRTSEKVTAGPYGSIDLSASYNASILYSEASGVEVEPFTFKVKGSGKVGIKVEVSEAGKLDVGQEVFDWELFIVQVGRYADGKFEAIDVRAGKDLMRLIAGLEQAGPKVEALVEKYAPDAVKKAAVKGAEWAAESDEAGKVAGVVDQGVRKIKQKTGIDVGGAVEEVVQSLGDEHGETSAEATARVNAELDAFGSSQEEFHAAVVASGINTTLGKFRTKAEYQAVAIKWHDEAERAIKGGPEPSEWKTMLKDLVSKARQRKAQKQAAEADARNKEDEAVRAAVAAMEAARTVALGQGNVLNNELAKAPNADAKKFLDQGWKPWAAAEAARQQAAALQGAAKSQKAKEATALYQQAKTAYSTGLQYL